MTRGVTDDTLTASDTYTEWMLTHGKFNLSVSGTWAGTLTLQRRFGLSGSALDVETHTANVEKQGEEFETDVYYRIGFKAAAYSSGSAVVRISQ